MLSIRRSLAAITALLVTSASCAPRIHHVAKSKPVIRLMTGTPGGGFYPLGQSLAAAYRSDVDVDHRESPGSVSNVVALQTGRADIALAYADVAYFAFAGTLEGHPERFDRLRGIAVLQRAPVHLVARAGSGIADVAGFPGKCVRGGAPGNSAPPPTALVLHAVSLHATSAPSRQL